MWVTRDECGTLKLFNNLPEKQNGWWQVIEEYDDIDSHGYIEDGYDINKSLFSELKWEDEPIEVELKKTNKTDITEEFLNSIGLRKENHYYKFIDLEPNSNYGDFISIEYNCYRWEIINGSYLNRQEYRSTHTASFNGDLYYIEDVFKALELCDIDINTIKEK